MCQSRNRSTQLCGFRQRSARSSADPRCKDSYQWSVASCQLRVTARLDRMSEQTQLFATLKLEYDGPLATITLNRPEKRNAISYELIDEVLRALAEVEQSSAQILILTGSGKAFCSGMDLDNLRAITRQTTEENEADSAKMARR